MQQNEVSNLAQQATEENHDADTPTAFYTATPGYSQNYHTPGRINPVTDFGKALTQEKLIEAKEVEINWSGRGQHVEYQPGDNIPLQVERTIGYSATALVESVRCRRIRLARKSIRCNPRRAKLEDLVQEVSYLHRLRHPHIIQLVGTYLQKDRFNILLYPVATGDLTKFMDEWPLKYYIASRRSSRTIHYQLDLARFFFCLASAIEFMHGKDIRHMDIKPSNILVHERRSLGKRTQRSVYLTDFGISRGFIREDGSQTDGPTSMTKRWCSPEVAAQESRGRPSDIFSLGCVFSEMYTALVRQSRDEFQRHREEDDGVDAFHLKLPRVKQWLCELDSKIDDDDDDDDDDDKYFEEYFEGDDEDDDEANLASSEQPGGSTPSAFIDLVIEMIDEDPSLRPTSSDLLSRLRAVKICGVGRKYTWRDVTGKGSCCSAPVEPYRVAEEDEIFEAFKFNEYLVDGRK